jgi:hypothetical protein
MGDTQLAAGLGDAARDAWCAALVILGELGHPDAAQVHAKLMQLELHAGSSERSCV